jgi:hypothetical protein
MTSKTKKWLGSPGNVKNLVMLDISGLPYRITYDGKPVYSIRCHRKLEDDLLKRLWNVWWAARAEVKKIHGYDESTTYYDNRTRAYLSAKHLDVYGGCYNNRSQRGSTATSSHAWGAALDWNPSENALGAKGNMPKWWIDVWTQRIGDIRWKWGGTWLRRDPMHVEVDYCGK